MVKNKYIGTSLVLATVLATIFAFSTPVDARGGPGAGKLNFIFDKMDANADGQVSQIEANNFHQAKFLEIDANADGFVTIDEAKAHRKKMRQEYKAKLITE